MSAADKLVLGVPSKGRLRETCEQVLSDAGMALIKTGSERGYRGQLAGMDGVDVLFLSAAEIADHLRRGAIHLGITGEDLLREQLGDLDGWIVIEKKMGFGHADVVVAVPEAWLDVRFMADLDDVAARFHREHGRRLRVATKYVSLVRQFFARKGVSGYRIVESLGATEGAPAAGTAEAIVDITSTGSTLKANHLRVLEDGLILSSQAVLVRALSAPRSKSGERLAQDIVDRLA